jgi:trimethylamine:corrinoid methyltransferase-like protein
MRVALSPPLSRHAGVLSWDAVTLDRLGEASIRAAVDVGLRLDDDHDGSCLAEAARAGCSVDRDERVVRFSERDVRDTIAVMRATLPAAPPPAEPATGRDRPLLVGNGANLLFDADRWTARAPDAADLCDACRWAQGADAVGTLFPPFMLKEIDQRLEPLYNYALLATHCGKDILHEQPTEPLHVRYLDRMARVVEAHRGFHQSMQEWEYINPPFRLSRRAVATMLERVDGGSCAVMGIGSMAVAGLTAPVTAAGLAVGAVAEVLAGLSFLHRLRPDAGLLGMVCAGSFDLRSGRVSYADMHTHLCNLAAWELLTRGLGVEAPCPTWYRDANEPGMQALYEFAQSQAFFSTTIGRSIPEIGGLASGNLFSTLQAALDIEAVRELDELGEGFTVDEEAVGLDEILRARFTPDYHIGTEHTIRHMLEGVPFSPFFPHGLGAGSRHDAGSTQTRELMDQAARSVREAIERGAAQAPDRSLANELYRFVEEAAQELGLTPPPLP